MPEYVRYRDDVETIDPDEAVTIERIVQVMTEGQNVTRKKYGQAVRISHAKAHGIVKGELIVEADLPPELAQGLFAVPRTYPVVVRLASVPGELLDDRKVSTPRGMAIKVLEVDGEKVAGHEGQRTQDFVLDTGKAFIVGGVKAFLQAFKPNAKIATHLSDTTKGVVSKAAEVGNKVLNAVGLDSAKLDFYGHPKFHPLGEAYYSQCPIRYGDYVAKLGVTPANPPLEALYEKVIDITDENGLRQATVDYFRTHPAEYDVSIQLCTDTESMPIEDASVEWPEDASPYRRVARLVLPPQNAFDDALQDTVDNDYSFSPAHSMAAHRPLGGIMRARLAVYPTLAKIRHDENARPRVEPAGDIGPPAPPLPATRSRSTQSPRDSAPMDDLAIARALGWASLAIAATEILGQGVVERDLLGIDEHPALLPALGLREAVAGATILSQTSITPTLAAGLWSRVAGDAMDLALLAAAGVRTRRPAALAVSTLMVLGITALDVVTAVRVQRAVASRR